MTKVTTTVYLDKELLEIIDQAISELRRYGRRISRSELITRAVLNYLEFYKPLFSKELQLKIEWFIRVKMMEPVVVRNE